MPISLKSNLICGCNFSATIRQTAVYSPPILQFSKPIVVPVPAQPKRSHGLIRGLMTGAKLSGFSFHMQTPCILTVKHTNWTVVEYKLGPAPNERAKCASTAFHFTSKLHQHGLRLQRSFFQLCAPLGL